MSSVFNPESDQIAEIERLELEVRDLRRRLEHTRGVDDRRVLQRQIEEVRLQIDRIRERLNPAPRPVKQMQSSAPRTGWRPIQAE